MTTESVLSTYLTDLRQLLPVPELTARAGEAVRPAEPYSDEQIEAALAFLQKSQLLQDALEQEWLQATDAYERSRAEVRMLAAAAADLAIAERLLSQPGTGAAPAATRGTTLVSYERLIQQALAEPERLLTPAPLPGYRGQSQLEVQAAAYKCLHAVQAGAIDASIDTITNLLAMDFAVVKEAAETVGLDPGTWMKDHANSAIQAAVQYVLRANEKLRLLLGPGGEETVRRGIAELLDSISGEEFIAQLIVKFLHIDTVIDESKDWIGAYQGEETVLLRTAQEIAALQGSFEGRMKIADVVVKGLAVVKVLGVIATQPLAPMLVAGAYLGLEGYILYSAHDHIDSDKYAFFDRVRGVRGTLMTQLRVSSLPPPPFTDVDPGV
ncbi:MAG: hypothetical protein GXP37_15225 [Chloroflexi bacterium]|nr:hypothetical protein [Chloroflexota bacterium]